MKILLAENDDATRCSLVETLRALGHEVRAVADGPQAWEAWLGEAYTLLIAAWRMPGLDGPGLCRRVRESQRMHYTYVVLLTGDSGVADYIDGIDAGADDLIAMPLEADLLDARLRVAERSLSLHDGLRQQAMHDRLTGMWNRGAILDSLQQDAERATREGRPLGVMMADLDHFKCVNDRHGHPVGDEVLKETAQRMKAALRGYDCIGRYGGEEFLIVTPNADREQALSVAQRICESIGATALATSVGPLAVTVSIGVAVAEGGRPVDPAALIASADAALYRAKDAGRNRVEIAVP